jgi:xylulose-5-phosphate/fructose-6-phosphate phosphoketolase
MFNKYQKVAIWLEKIHRFTNYVGVAQLYLEKNYFLEKELEIADIKPRILGHWGTVPGLNLIYGGLSYLQHTHANKNMLIAGPGHGAPAILANLWLEGTLTRFYPKYTMDKAGLGNLIHDFSWPSGFPSHTYPGVPGSIQEGGELGYSLGTAFGAAFNNPDWLFSTVIGDGEAETGALAASWQSLKFWNPKNDGAVLPILHLNGYKISNPTLFGVSSNEELHQHFTSLGYEPIFVDQNETNDIYLKYIEALDRAYLRIIEIKQTWRPGQKPTCPLIILRTKKGWTGPLESGGKKMEDNNLSHGIPIKNPKTNKAELEALNTWLKSYNPSEFFDAKKDISQDLFEFIPEQTYRLGEALEVLKSEFAELELPDLSNHFVAFKERGLTSDSELLQAGEYLAEVISLNKDSFRVFSPDESESNKLDPLFLVTDRQFSWPVRAWDKHFSESGQVLEILSEQTLQSWMMGYILSGRYGVLISYEAFLGIISSQIDQYIKYLKQSREISWRPDLPSMNYIATSSVWRQDHNGFTHQNPVLINSLLAKQVDFVQVYFPADVNTMLCIMQKTLASKNTVNLIVSGKTELPVWLSSEEAQTQLREGVTEWKWASSSEEPEIVLVSAGDYQTLETLAAIDWLRKNCPELKFRFLNITELTCLGIGNDYCPSLPEETISKLFTPDKPVLLNFHGYPEAIKQLVYGHSLSQRLKIIGYIEKGTTTTPFDMQVLNGTSRYHVAKEAIMTVAKTNPEIHTKASHLISQLNNLLARHALYIIENGEDMPEVQQWSWSR